MYQKKTFVILILKNFCAIYEWLNIVHTSNSMTLQQDTCLSAKVVITLLTRNEKLKQNIYFIFNTNFIYNYVFKFF